MIELFNNFGHWFYKYVFNVKNSFVEFLALEPAMIKI